MLQEVNNSLYLRNDIFLNFFSNPLSPFFFLIQNIFFLGERPKKPTPLQDQTVRDEKGRYKRFHGAFSGGFSAGYFNTVGSKEGMIFLLIAIFLLKQVIEMSQDSRLPTSLFKKLTITF